MRTAPMCSRSLGWSARGLPWGRCSRAPGNDPHPRGLTFPRKSRLNRPNAIRKGRTDFASGLFSGAQGVGTSAAPGRSSAIRWTISAASWTKNSRCTSVVSAYSLTRNLAILRPRSGRDLGSSRQILGDTLDDLGGKLDEELTLHERRLGILVDQESRDPPPPLGELPLVRRYPGVLFSPEVRIRRRRIVDAVADRRLQPPIPGVAHSRSASVGPREYLHFSHM